METGDGLLIRVRPRAGMFTTADLGAVARIAAQFGNGVVDLTNRANLQMRGFTTETVPAALDALRDAGLLDVSPAVEAVRNVVVDPRAGLDPGRIDVHPLAAAFEAELGRATDVLALPGKFGFAFYGAHETAPSVAADITAVALDAASCAIMLDGASVMAATVSMSEAPMAMLSLARAFLSMRAENPNVRRMRDAVDAAGAPALFRQAGLAASAQCAPVQAAAPIGVLSADAPFAVGIGFPFGRIDAPSLARLVEIARQLGIAKTHPSAARALVFPVGSVDDATALVAHAGTLGLIIDPADARLGVDVCPGSPLCGRASTDTRRDTEDLAGRARIAGSIHVSGCIKGCAHPGRAALTFVARDGAYDLVVGGTTNDAPRRVGIAPAGLAAAAVAELEPMRS
jgi:precorrin-3B synthase